MKNTLLKLLFGLNNALLILYMSFLITKEQSIIESSIPLLISSFMLIDITYISVCNLRENKVLTLFCGLLALNSWYVLLSFGSSKLESFAFAALSPMIWYLSIKFLLMFLFQNSGYRFRKITNTLLYITTVLSLVGLFISDSIYAIFYGIQFITIWLCFLFILIYHWKRITFVLKSEWKCFLFSTAIIASLFLIYYFATTAIQGHLSNFGIYLPMLLFSFSIHGTAFSEHRSNPLSTIFTKTQALVILGTSALMLGLMVWLLSGSFNTFLVLLDALFSLIYLCNILLEYRLKQSKHIASDNNYSVALQQLKQEESLKASFAIFLHDDVLQDLLSIKNMLTKAHRPEVQNIIRETLENLNTRIREQMQDYHPVLLKKLTAKENYQSLIKGVSQAFPHRSISVSFTCLDTLFLVDPYNILTYRLIKELLTNVYKHSDGNQAWITLTQKNSLIELSICDNGTACANSLTSEDKTTHKGLPSIFEQINALDGSIYLSDNKPQGVCIQIKIPMKGDVSYKYFTR